MRLRRLGIRGFGCHEELVLELPPRGVVLVHGPNGAGKSTLVEAIAAACWGESVRGEQPPTLIGGQVAVELDDGACVRRSFGRGRDRLEVVHVDGSVEHPATVTKGRELVESLVGTWEAWRRTHVLSVHDAQGFSLATDKARKELVEGLLGLHRFEAAAKRASAAASTDRANLRSAELELRGAEARVAAESAAVERFAAGQQPSPGEDEAALRSALEECLAQTARVQQAISPIDTQLQTLPPLPLGHCPTCSRPWPDAEQRAELAAERDRLLQLRAPLASQMTARANDRYVLERRLHEAALARQAAASWEQMRNQAAAALADAFDAEDAARHQLENATRAVHVSETVAKAFAPTGVRAQVTKAALERMAAQASMWVGRITAGWVVQLSLGESGRQLDAIQLRVGPPNALRSYRACSVGERRRVDVGLCLALRELGARAGASGAGTIWADDLFGNLDADGSARLAEVLCEEAERVCVVVLDPSDHLRALLRPVQVVQIAGGPEHSTHEVSC